MWSWPSDLRNNQLHLCFKNTSCVLLVFVYFFFFNYLVRVCVQEMTGRTLDPSCGAESLPKLIDILAEEGVLQVERAGPSKSFRVSYKGFVFVDHSYRALTDINKSYAARIESFEERKKKIICYELSKLEHFKDFSVLLKTTLNPILCFFNETHSILC